MAIPTSVYVLDKGGSEITHSGRLKSSDTIATLLNDSNLISAGITEVSATIGGEALSHDSIINNVLSLHPDYSETFVCYKYIEKTYPETIAGQIERLQDAKAAIKTSIESKGVTVGSSVKLDEYASCIDEIQQGATEGILPITAPTLTGVAEHGKNCLRLDDPNDDSCRGTQLTCWTKSTVVRKVGSSPASIDDGTVVFTTTTKDQYASTYYVDSGLTNGCTYHYRAFADVSVGKPNCSSVVCLKPTAGAKIDILLVGGGGGGGGAGSYAGGGGGGGQVRICTGINIGATTNVVIGEGGGSGAGGGNTQVGNITVYGGGYGGGSESQGQYSCGNGGGGGGAYAYGQCGGCGCDHNGGNAYYSMPGGGAGAGANGGGGSYDNPGSGGAGCTTNFTGKSETFSGGGGGGGGSPSGSEPGASGGSGGGGNGGNDCRYGGAATFYGGGGGGAGYYRGGSAGGSGYKGLVVIKYPTSCGYTITGGQCCYTCNGYKYHCFTSSGTITVS